MRQTLRTLHSLQEIDTDIFRVSEELRRLPLEREKRREEIDGLLSRRNDYDQEIVGLRARIKEIEDHTTAQRQRMRKLETQANNSRGDAALMAAFQHEIRTIKRDVSEFEEEGLQFVERSDALTSQRDDLTVKIEAAEQVFAEYNANVEKELAEAQKRYEALQKDRAGRMGEGVKPDILDTYDRLLQAREGVAMCRLEVRTCQGCYMEVPPNIQVRLSRGMDLVQCPSCDRILFIDQQIS